MNNWPKKITVDKRIIGTLSSSTYENFPQALKELIVNSYDADASKVDLIIEKENEAIIIEDTGKGMSEDDFDFYLRIAGKTRRKSDYTEGGRRIVGKFGVGFLAVFPFCKIYEIETTRRGSAELIKARINCEKYFTFDENTTIDVDSVPIFGVIARDEKIRSKQFTKIRLLGFTKLMKSFFNKEYETTKKNSIKNFDPLKLIEWELCEYLPIQYKDKEFNEIFALDEGTPFEVFFNGKRLVRNKHVATTLETHGDSFEQIGNIKFRYFIGTDFRTIKPIEARYIFIRNFNVGVGSRTTFGIGLDSRLYSKLAWLCIEIDVIEGLNDLIAVSRDRFNYSPDYEKFKDFFREKLRYWATTIEEINTLEKLISSKSQSRIIEFEDDKERQKEKIIKSLEKRGVNIEIKKTEEIDEEKSLGDKIEVFKEKKDLKKGETTDELFPKKKSLEEANREGSTFIKERFQDSLRVEISETESKRTIRIGDEEYEIVNMNWHISELFPACKIEGKKLVINKAYKLFHNKSLLDVFVKFHFILVKKHQEGLISDSILRNLNRSVEKIFSDYL